MDFEPIREKRKEGSRFIHYWSLSSSKHLYVQLGQDRIPHPPRAQYHQRRYQRHDDKGERWDVALDHTPEDTPHRDGQDPSLCGLDGRRLDVLGSLGLVGTHQRREEEPREQKGKGRDQDRTDVEGAVNGRVRGLADGGKYQQGGSVDG